jgi:hypothetical protein
VEYINKINTLLEKLDADLTNMEDKGLKWDYIKCEIRGTTLKHSFSVNKEKRKYHQELTQQLNILQARLSANADSTTLKEYENTKSKLENIEEEKIKGAILRSKVKWAEAGERNSKYFLSLEKRNAINKTIIRLQNESGNMVEDQKGVLKECNSYYQNLYTEKNTSNPRSPRLTGLEILRAHCS